MPTRFPKAERGYDRRAGFVKSKGKSMDTHAQMEAEWACRKLAEDFCYYVDRRELDELGALFAEDGVMQHPEGGKAVGPSAIAELMGPRDRGVTHRHLVAGFHFTAVDDDHLDCVSYYTIFWAGGHTEMDGVADHLDLAPAPGSGLAGEFQDSFVRTSDGWRFARRIPLHIVNGQS